MDAKTILREGIEAWNAHDRDRFLALYDSDVRYFDQPTGREFVGRGDFGKGFYDLWTEAYPDNQLKDPVIFAEGELACLQARFVGTHTGILHGPELEMPPTDKRIDAPFAFIAQIRNGKVTKAWHYYDRLLAFEQEEVLTVDKLFAQLPVG